MRRYPGDLCVRFLELGVTLFPPLRCCLSDDFRTHPIPLFPSHPFGDPFPIEGGEPPVFSYGHLTAFLGSVILMPIPSPCGIIVEHSI